MRKFSPIAISFLAALALSGCGENVGNQNQAGSGDGDTAGQGSASGRTDTQATAPATETMEEPTQPGQ